MGDSNQKKIAISISRNTVFSIPYKKKNGCVDVQELSLVNNYDDAMVPPGTKIVVGNNTFVLVDQIYQKDKIPTADKGNALQTLRIKKDTPIRLNGIPTYLADELEVTVPMDCTIIVREGTFIQQLHADFCANLQKDCEAQLVSP